MNQHKAYDIHTHTIHAISILPYGKICCRHNINAANNPRYQIGADIPTRDDTHTCRKCFRNHCPNCSPTVNNRDRVPTTSDWICMRCGQKTFTIEDSKIGMTLLTQLQADSIVSELEF